MYVCNVMSVSVVCWAPSVPLGEREAVCVGLRVCIAIDSWPLRYIYIQIQKVIIRDKSEQAHARF